MASTCVNGARECDGCMRCKENTELVCPVCECELSRRDMVYTHNGEVVGCGHCIEESTAGDELE